MFVDTHCHLNVPSLILQLPELLQRAQAAGVTRFVLPGVAPSCWDDLVAVAGRDSRIFAAPGIHPLMAMGFNEETVAKLERLACHAVAIGEIGLDYSDDTVPRLIQQTAFRLQLRLALRCGLPVILHCRRAFADLLQILREENVAKVGGVMHAFSGSPETAQECIRLGLHIGVAGPVTYPNAVRPLEVVRRIPLEHLLLESDAPDLTPVPHRGSLNEPAFLLETARRMAAIKGISLEQIAAVTTTNARQLFGLP